MVEYFVNTVPQNEYVSESSFHNENSRQKRALDKFFSQEHAQGEDFLTFFEKEQITKEKKELLRRVEYLDRCINDSEELKKELLKDKTAKNEAEIKKDLMVEREKCIKQIMEYNKKLDPRQLIKQIKKNKVNNVAIFKELIEGLDTYIVKVEDSDLKNELAKVLNELKSLKKGENVSEDLLEVIRLITVTMDGMKDE